MCVGLVLVFLFSCFLKKFCHFRFFFFFFFHIPSSKLFFVVLVKTHFSCFCLFAREFGQHHEILIGMQSYCMLGINS